MVTIIAYRTAKDIDLQFEDGYIIQHASYVNYLTGKIRHPDHSMHIKSRIGESKIANNGMQMTIIAYRGVNDIDVQFADGAIVYNKTYGSFTRGQIKNPNIPIHYHPERYIGKTVVANNGMKMTIIDYRSSNDIDIVFEDGTKVYHRSYGSFSSGGIAHPNINTLSVPKRSQRLGKTIQAKNGMKMTIIAYRSKLDMDVQFEDGVIVNNVRYNNFRKGMVKHPKINPLRKLDRIGEISLSSHGLSMQISDYVNGHNVTVLFESGYSASNKHYRNFKSGRISHPFPYQIGNISMDKPAYIYQDTGFFFCHCIKTNRVGIMSVDEIKACPCQTLQIEKRTKETQAIEE